MWGFGMVKCRAMLPMKGVWTHSLSSIGCMLTPKPHLWVMGCQSYCLMTSGEQVRVTALFLNCAGNTPLQQEGSRAASGTDLLSVLPQVGASHCVG